jgi:hypothetical protein
MHELKTELQFLRGEMKKVRFFLLFRFFLEEPDVVLSHAI